MLLKYRFKVKSRIRISEVHPIVTKKFTFTLELGNASEVSHIVTIVSLSSRDMWPSLKPSIEAGISANLNITSPFYDEVCHELRVIEGALSLFGMESIDLESPIFEWIAETPEEKLDVFNFSFAKEARPIESMDFIPFELIASTIICSGKLYGIEVALSFFRKGKIDVSERKYIEAIFDFVFMIETLFAEGKFKTNQVESLYLANDVLQRNIAKTLSDSDLLEMSTHEPKVSAAFQSTYVDKTPSQLTIHFVNLRGLLHHHSSKRVDSWHPEDHLRFGADALFLQSLCTHIALELVTPHIFSKETVESYQSQFNIT